MPEQLIQNKRVTVSFTVLHTISLDFSYKKLLQLEVFLLVIVCARMATVMMMASMPMMMMMMTMMVMLCPPHLCFPFEFNPKRLNLCVFGYFNCNPSIYDVSTSEGVARIDSIVGNRNLLNSL